MLKREELNLKSKWWHRLLVILFVCSFGLFFWYQIVSVENLFFPIPQWQKVNTLGERLDSKLNSVYDITKEREIIDSINSSSLSLNYKNKREILNEATINGLSTREIYCSNQIQNYIELIMKDKKLDYFYNYNSKKLNDGISYNDFIKNINENNIKCVITDANSTYNTQGQVTGRVTFLRTADDLFLGEKIQNNQVFYKISILKSILCYLANLIGILLYSLVLFYIIIIIYYKIILYIIFGSKKETS